MKGKPGNHGNTTAIHKVAPRTQGSLAGGVNSHNKGFSVPVGTGRLLFVMVLGTSLWADDSGGKNVSRSFLPTLPCFMNR